MAAGDVVVQFFSLSTALIDTGITAMRVTANDKWMMCSIANGTQICVAHIEEA